MLRDKNLIPLSHQHQHALALCVRLERAIQTGEVELEAWQSEIQQIAEQEISVHFSAEEKEIFPAAEQFTELQALVAELRQEHKSLREYFARAAARSLDRDGLQEFAQRLASHIRKEERQLFEEMQRRMTPEKLTGIGAALNQALEQTSNACLIPNEATRLRPKS
jgi:hemerythrin-like domain-containing protein